MNFTTFFISIIFFSNPVLAEKLVKDDSQETIKSVQEKQMFDFGTVYDPSGNHRLSLLFIGIKDGQDFHSLVWEQKEKGVWTTRKEITKAAFEANRERRRWVHKLFSFEPTTGHTIIQVAEADAPNDATEINYFYSWRKWDLLNNSEVELLQNCKNPFEPYKLGVEEP
jgi:hypothetical protein